jgi:hypothetical protein
MEPNRLSIEANGEAEATILVRLYDRLDRPVRRADLTVGCTYGTAELLGERSDGYRIRYVAPPTAPEGGSDVLVVRQGDYEVSQEIELVVPHRLELGAAVGWDTNFGGVSSSFGAIEARWRIPVLEDRVLVATQLGLSHASADDDPNVVGSTTTEVWLVPWSLEALYAVPVADSVAFEVGLGFVMRIIHARVGPVTSTFVAPGGTMSAGASIRLGPGAVFARGDLFVIHISDALVVLRGVGATLAFGYRVVL